MRSLLLAALALALMVPCASQAVRIQEAPNRGVLLKLSRNVGVDATKLPQLSRTRKQGRVRVLDLFDLADEGPEITGGGSGMPAVPEPTTASLLALGLGALALTRRRRA
jgi:hypothetical protein